MPAAGCPERHDVIALLEAPRVGADRRHDARALMAPGDRIRLDGHVAGRQVIVGVAEPAGRQLHLNLARPGVRDVEFDHLPGSWCLAHDGAASLHAVLLAEDPVFGEPTPVAQRSRMAAVRVLAKPPKPVPSPCREPARAPYTRPMIPTLARDKAPVTAHAE
jgi:hypothetical protein